MTEPRKMIIDVTLKTKKCSSYLAPKTKIAPAAALLKTLLFIRRENNEERNFDELDEFDDFFAEKIEEFKTDTQTNDDRSQNELNDERIENSFPSNLN